MRKILVLGLSLLTVTIIGCSSENSLNFKDKSNPGEDVIESKLLNRANLKLDWQNDISLASGENVKHLIVAESYVYVITNQNTVFCFERFDGKLRFIKQFARPSLPINRPSEFEGSLYTAVGDELWKLDPENATVKMVQELENSAVAPVVFARENRYVSGLDNRISCYDREDDWLKFQVTADDDSRIVSVIVDDDMMWFATKTGYIYNASSLEPVKHWAFKASDEIAGDIVKDGKYLYASSYDTMVYKLSAISGILEWKVPLGSALMECPIVYDDYVYQKSSRDGVYALNKEDGSIVWQESDGKSFVASAGEDVYVFTENSILSVMNNKTGKAKFKLNFSNIEKCARNVYDENIYVLSKDGKFAKISRQ